MKNDCSLLSASASHPGKAVRLFQSLSSLFSSVVRKGFASALIFCALSPLFLPWLSLVSK